MDIGYTYATPGDLTVTVYAPPGFDVPSTFQIREQSTGEIVNALRVSDRDMTCGKVAGVDGECTSHDCHRRVLGECQCGRHGRDGDGNKVPVPFTKEVAS